MHLFINFVIFSVTENESCQLLLQVHKIGQLVVVSLTPHQQSVLQLPRCLHIPFLSILQERRFYYPEERNYTKESNGLLDYTVWEVQRWKKDFCLCLHSLSLLVGDVKN